MYKYLLRTYQSINHFKVLNCLAENPDFGGVSAYILLYALLLVKSSIRSGSEPLSTPCYEHKMAATQIIGRMSISGVKNFHCSLPGRS